MSWDSDFNKFLNNFDERTADLAIDVALEIHTRFTLRSPVDTGFFRGNWQVDQGAEPLGTVDIRSEDETISAGQAVIGQWDLSNLLYIVNNTEYGIFLEDGHSDQAPKGIVDVTLLEFESILKESLNDLL